jgi:hypothetical protein
VGGNEPVNFDLKTVALLRDVLAHAWACLPPKQQATTSRTLLAEGLLKSAANGERDPERLRDAAFIALDAQHNL